ERQKAHTFMKRGDIFENPVTGKPWHDERSQRDHYWNPTLLRLGIRRRRAYATRATWATKLIMAGLKPAYIANQLGHTVMVLLTVYARWIEKADKGNEAAEVAKLFKTEKSALEEPKK
ncbi:MAG: integrase, partial [Burkholderiales bacterium]